MILNDFGQIDRGRPASAGLLSFASSSASTPVGIARSAVPRHGTRRGILRFCFTAGSQPTASQKVSYMLRVNYVRPEQMPQHQRDFPRRELAQLPDFSGSRSLALMVAGYLIAMFAGIGLLGYLTAPTPPSTSMAAGSVALKE